ncbi:cytochrome P450 [Paraburkholderia oxyphila]|uniref:cytochrome P450 n=1 Tax=Paraburkholderia oxyphila TaxID=614212 RepID=UPI000480396B|nr:cytochrome P450 [Paraburkholderia oxyphila]
MEAAIDNFPPHVSRLNPLAPGVAMDPFPIYKELRESGPVVWLESLGVWGVFRDAMVRQLANDLELFTAEGGTGLQNYFREKPWREPSPILEVDPPVHTRRRSILTRILSPGALNKLKSQFSASAESIVGRIVERGTFDGIADYAKAFPMQVFLDAVGVPDGERENVLLYNDLVRKSRTVKLSDWDSTDRDAAEAMAKWIDKFCSRKSVAEGSFGAYLYAAVDNGELDEHEADVLLRSFVSAGTETTIAAIGNTLYCLASHPDQWAIVKADPTKARAAFEESLRFDPPAQFLGRCARKEFVWEGVRIGQHDKILGFISAANRDPDRWSDPDKYLIDRNTVGHLGLGTGIHGCVGQMLARLEGEILLKALIERVNAIEVVGEPVRNQSGFRGFKSLPMRVQVQS